MSARKEIDLLANFIKVLEGLSKDILDVSKQCTTLISQTDKILINAADKDHHDLQTLQQEHDLAVVVDQNVLIGTAEIRKQGTVITQLLSTNSQG